MCRLWHAVFCKVATDFTPNAVVGDVVTFDLHKTMQDYSRSWWVKFEDMKNAIYNEDIQVPSCSFMRPYAARCMLLITGNSEAYPQE